MSKPLRIGSAVSFIALASMVAGCAASHDTVASASSFGGKTDGEVGLATRALAALNSNDIPTAINFAERAVAKTPDDAGFRSLLGNAYFAGGRFASAEAAYKDALSIYSNQPQIVLKLALVEIAQGKGSEAVALLNSSRALVDAADYGLALALAGHSDDAISTLEGAARADGADARVRQNLALAYAFAGDWTKARTIAAQDVPADQLDARIQQWMQLAKPTHASDQVAALTGVAPAAGDPGQPVRLALRKADTQVAEAAPAAAEPQVVEAAQAPQPDAAQAAPAPQFAEAAPAPQPEAAVPAPPPADSGRVAARFETPAPMTVAMAAAASPEAPAAFAAFAPQVRAPVVQTAKVRPPVIKAAALRRGNSGAVMQLGSYRSPQYVTAAWGQLSQRYPALRAYLPMRARFDSPNGTYWRLSITGFGNQREALARCQLLKNRGGSCFVRNFAGDAPVQIASR